MDIEEIQHGVYFLYRKSKPLGKKVLVSTDSMSQLYWDKQNTEESDCQTLPRQDVAVLQIFCFTEKSVRYSRPVGWRWMSQCYRGTLSDCPGSLLSLSFLQFWKFFALYFLFTRVIYPFQVSVWGSFVTKLKKKTYKRDVKFIKVERHKSLSCLAKKMFPGLKRYF